MNGSTNKIGFIIDQLCRQACGFWISRKRRKADTIVKSFFISRTMQCNGEEEEIMQVLFTQLFTRQHIYIQCLGRKRNNFQEKWLSAWIHYIRTNLPSREHLKKWQAQYTVHSAYTVLITLFSSYGTNFSAYFTISALFIS